MAVVILILSMPQGIKHLLSYLWAHTQAMMKSNSGRPFSGSSGGILRTELGRMGVDVSRIRMCNLWLHAPNKNEKCLQAGLVYLLKETKGKRLWCCLVLNL